MTVIYLDNNATTPIAEEVLEVMLKVSREAYGNPGSRHPAGRRARQVLEDARESIAALLGAETKEVVFTSGGTEASNLALRSLARKQGVVAVPSGEHPATEQVVKDLQRRGYRRHVLLMDALGRLQDVTLPTETVCATALLAHNETGTIQDLSELVANCRAQHVPLHVDAVQAVGKIPVHFHDLGASTLALGAHKFHGPRGIGALLVRSEVQLLPQLLGGHQEQGRRAGTESVALAAGMARALEICCSNMAARAEHLQQLRDRLQTGLQAACPPVVVNGDQQQRLPNTLNIAFPGCAAEALLVSLDLLGICCSHGSACASGSAEPAPILVAMRAPVEVQQSALRFSVGIQNSIDEIDRAVEEVAGVVQRLRQATST